MRYLPGKIKPIQTDLKRAVREGGGRMRKIATYLIPLLLLALLIGATNCTSAAQCSALCPA